MKKIKITEADHLEKEWMLDAENQTLETLPKFINHLMNDYKHDYRTIVKATAAAMIATFDVCNKSVPDEFTGFQVDFIPWFMMDKFWGESEIGRKCIDFDYMLYPQYANKFEKIIPENMWKKLQENAKKNLIENIDSMHPDVVAHMQSIVDGKIPFKYKVKEE